MSARERFVDDEADDEFHTGQEKKSQKPKKKKTLAFDKVERALLIASVVMIGTAVKFGFSWGGPKVEIGSGRMLVLEIVRVGSLSGVTPAQYDPRKELRIPVAERKKDNRLEPVVLIVRGPWHFGVASTQEVASAVGEPGRQGQGHLTYDLAEGKIRLTLLFNAGRLDTVALSPNACPAGTASCTDPYSWGLTEEQMQEMSLQHQISALPDAACGAAETPGGEIHYNVCVGQSSPSVEGIYVQRLTPEMKNPPVPRGLSAADGTLSERGRCGLSEEEYTRLVAQYREAIRLKEKALGPEHASVQFLSFELGRMEAESGREAEGRKIMNEAVQAVERTLGPDHPDTRTMRAWSVAARKSGGTKPDLPVLEVFRGQTVSRLLPGPCSPTEE